MIEQYREMMLGYRFSAVDRAADADQIISSVQAMFVTTTDEKDQYDGISESYNRGAEILASNASFGSDLIFGNGSTN